MMLQERVQSERICGQQLQNKKTRGSDLLVSFFSGILLFSQAVSGPGRPLKTARG